LHRELWSFQAPVSSRTFNSFRVASINAFANDYYLDITFNSFLVASSYGFLCTRAALMLPFNSFLVASNLTWCIYYQDERLSILSELHHEIMHSLVAVDWAFNSFWVASRQVLSGATIKLRNFFVLTFNSFWVASVAGR